MPVFTYHTLDVFTTELFGGNPLAVFPDARGIDDDTMQRVARELNLSETVFCFPAVGAGDASVRIFTPGKEVPFAGHPTVGTAALLVDEGRVPGEVEEGVRKVVLEERVGNVPVDVEVVDGRAVRATLTTAAEPTEFPFRGSRVDLARMLGITEADLGWEPARRPVGVRPDAETGAAWASAGLEFFVVPVRSVEVAGRCVLDVGVRSQLLDDPGRATMVYAVAPGAADSEFHVRMFAPEIGVPEDPATGSACAALGGWLGPRLSRGPHRWEVRQGVEMGRPSRLTLDVECEQGRAGTIRVGGGVVRVASGEMNLPV